MSILMEGINSVNALTSQINKLSSLDQEALKDPDAIKYALEQNFNQMLNDLISSGSDDDDDDKNSSDPFGFFMTSQQNYIEQLNTQNTSESAADLASFNEILSQGDTAYLDSLSMLQDNILTLQV